MAKNRTSIVKRDAASGTFPSAEIRGKASPISKEFVLVQVSQPKRAAVVPPSDQARVLVTKAAQALKKPGIEKSVVFGRAHSGKIFAYSAYPGDTSLIVRESADGKRSVGRLGTDGRFRPSNKVA